MRMTSSGFCSRFPRGMDSPAAGSRYAQAFAGIARRLWVYITLIEFWREIEKGLLDKYE
jgi:hypothetical protein